MSTNGGDRSSSAAGPAPDQGGVIAPEDSFLVQIRGGSRLPEQAISGRIEHLYSGDSEQFGSLAELFDFLARHFGSAGCETEPARSR